MRLTNELIAARKTRPELAQILWVSALDGQPDSLGALAAALLAHEAVAECGVVGAPNPER